MWEPVLIRRRPFYRGIVAALERDIAAGVLAAGERLPTHRALADRLDVTVGMVTKAYTEAERLGLIASRVGRGSYVLQFPETVGKGDTQPGSVVDLSLNVATIEPFNRLLNRVLGALSRRKSLHGLLEYQAIPGLERHRAAGAKWLGLRGIKAPADRMILCNGAQEALMAVLATVARPGEAVLTESLNYAGIKRIADLFHLEIRGVATDAEGLRPDELLRAAQGRKIGCILCSPTLHNPTNAIMSLARRQEILRIAGDLGVHVIENDSYGHLSGDTTPTMTSLAAERCIYLCGLSKSIAPGLRIGFILSPAHIMEQLSEAIHATSWTSPTLMGEIASVLIEDRLAERFVAGHRVEALARARAAREILGCTELPPACPTYHLWLPLPEPWLAGEFCAELRRAGVIVAPADVFAVDRTPAPHAIRISLGGVRERERLVQALQVVADTLSRRALTVRSIA
jgi:DNA-binding transcriptional MocR family regulator